MSNSTQRELTIYMAHDRVTGKCYFGSTFQPLEKRIKQHIYYANKNSRCGHFYGILSKRPEKVFWLQIESHKVTIPNNADARYTNSVLRAHEQVWIDKYWDCEWLLNYKKNVTGFATGTQNPNCTPEWKANMKKILSGWRNPMAKHNRAWQYARECYDYYHLKNGIGYAKMREHINSTYNEKFSRSQFANLIKLFEEDWNPYEDDDWSKEFDKDIV